MERVDRGNLGNPPCESNGMSLFDWMRLGAAACLLALALLILIANVVLLIEKRSGRATDSGFIPFIGPLTAAAGVLLLPFSELAARGVVALTVLFADPWGVIYIVGAWRQYKKVISKAPVIEPDDDS